MMNFRGIYECALHQRGGEEVEEDRVKQLRESLGADVSFPPQCPWVGSDPWLWRFIQRADEALLEPLEKDAATGLEIAHPDARQRVLSCLKWRHEFGANDILHTKEPAILQMHREWPLHMHGVDQRGVPVVFEEIAHVYPKPFLERFSVEEAFRFAIYSREWLAREIYQRTEGKYSRYLFIESATGLGIRHGHSPLFTLLDLIFMNDERNYPNSCSHYLLVNTPWLFSMFKWILTPFVNSEPLSKIKAQSTGYHAELAEHMDLSMVPIEFGGKCTSCSHHHKDGVIKCFPDFSEAGLLAPCLTQGSPDVRPLMPAENVSTTDEPRD